MNNEDIKVLEELKEKYITSGLYQIGTFELTEEEKEAIENLIKGYKELEENLKIATAMLTKGTYPEQNENDNNFNKQFIPKSKVREKIEELKERTEHLMNSGIDLTWKEYYEAQIDLCEELLQEGDK